ncbi:hypothetical protein BH20ACT15_BH20ACT15_01640 [soil metagenome]
MKQLERDPDAFEAALLEERPEISREFAAELDSWAAEGFPAREDAPRRSGWGDLRSRLSGIRLSGMLAPAAGLAVALIAVVIGVSSLQDTGTDGVGGGSSEDSAPQATVEESAGDDLAEPNAPLPPQGGGQFKPGKERIQERTVTTTLSADTDEVAEVADGVVEVTERYDGIVSSSNVSTSGDRGRATFALRIPTQNLQAFLSDLSDLASVKARSEGSTDITAPFVTAEERFADAKAEVDSLVAQLAEADTTSELDDVKVRLSVARRELATARADLAQLKRRADFSQVSVTVTGEGDADGWSLGDAAGDALSVLSDLAGAALVALAAIVPLGLVAAAVWFATKGLRRRRESALDD